MSLRFDLPGDLRLRTILVVASFLCVAGCLAGLVAVSLATLTSTADRIDDGRAMHAAVAAEKALRKQLAGTVRDNAYWNDAYTHITSRDVAWTIENWGITSKDYPLYDTVMVIGPHDESVMAYHNGMPLKEGPYAYFNPSLHALLTRARSVNETRDKLPVQFISSRDGVAVIGASPIQPAAGAVDANKSYVLLFAKHLKPESLAELSDSAGLADLQLNAAPQAGRLALPLLDANGKRIGDFSWRSERPGTESFNSIRPLVNAAALGLVLFLIGIVIVGHRVIRNLMREEAKSRRRALHDPLTGLLNRDGLSATYGNMRTAAPHVCLHLIDLDGFKGVNDLWGHQVGDTLIRAVADRLRALAPLTAIIARLGGDEFALMDVNAKAEDWEGVGRTIQEELTKPYMLDDRLVEVGCSVGQAITTDDHDIFELLRKADIALYRAKDAGRGITVRFDEAFDIELAERAALEQDLRESLEREDIEVVFQPLIDAKTRSVRGVEALARWKSAKHGQVSPEVFIPLAERAGLIETLGLQVLRKALIGGLRWPDIGLSVNASPVQLRNPFFVRQVKQLLEEIRFEPTRLTIEITEGVLISNPDQAERAILGLKALGIKIALDDFGTGYASIGTLRKFKFDRLKIDRSLVVAADESTDGGRVLQATIALADALNIPVTAEGIEKEQQALALRLSGCDQLQGYLFSRPVPADNISKQLEAIQKAS